MQPFFMLGILILFIILAFRTRGKNSQAEQYYAAMLARSGTYSERFTADMLTGLPAPAESYFKHSVAPGAYLKFGCELQMTGRCAMGGPGWPRRQKLSAKEVIRRPNEYVWLIKTFTPLASAWQGHDISLDGRWWSTFSMSGIEDYSPVRERILLARRIAETLWVPAALLPQTGTRWEALAADTARITFEVLGNWCSAELHLNADGSVRQLEARSFGNLDSRCVNGQLTITAFESTWYDDYRIPKRLSCSMLHDGRQFEFLELELKYLRYR